MIIFAFAIIQSFFILYDYLVFLIISHSANLYVICKSVIATLMKILNGIEHWTVAYHKAGLILKGGGAGEGV